MKKPRLGAKAEAREQAEQRDVSAIVAAGSARICRACTARPLAQRFAKRSPCLAHLSLIINGYERELV